METKQQYNLVTALSMVVGIVIGSGIFFKADDILTATNASVKLGLLGFLIVGTGVVFGALVISLYAIKDKKHLGIIGYAQMALGRKFAYLVGWFSISVYFPALIVVLAMVAAIYVGILFDIDSQIFVALMTALFLIQAFVINLKSPSFGGRIQVLTTIAKIIPLVVIGLVGIFLFDSPAAVSEVSTTSSEALNPLSMLIIIAFAFDGWIVATNISGELQNTELNLPRALALGTIVITVIYCIYFLGITHLVSPTKIISLGDAHTQVAAQTILGPIGGKLITLFVIISVYGGLNGMTLAYLRLPNLLLETKLMKNIYGNDKVKQDKNMLFFTIFWVLAYYLFEQLIDFGVIFQNLAIPFDLSSLPILINYIFYFLLFVVANYLVRKDSINKRIYCLLASIIAAFTAAIVIYGSLFSNGLLYICISVIICVIGFAFYQVEAK